MSYLLSKLLVDSASERLSIDVNQASLHPVPVDTKSTHLTLRTSFVDSESNEVCHLSAIYATLHHGDNHPFTIFLLQQDGALV